MISKDPCEVQMKVNAVRSFLSQCECVVKRISLLIGEGGKVTGCFLLKRLLYVDINNILRKPND